MSRLSKLLETRPTGVQKADYAPFASVVKHEPVEIGPCGFGVLREHVHKLTVGTVFTCNDVQYQSAAKNAERLMFDTLFAEVKIHVREAMNAIYGRDYQSAMKALENAMKEMEP